MMISEGMKNLKIPQFGCRDANPEFSLSNPSLLNGRYVVYKITGVDNEGYFTGNRRYNEFYLLRQVLIQNFPGIYIPAVPGKKVVGNKDFKFILERRYYLERFFLKLSSRPFLIDSREGKVFSRPKLE
jgi:sorting nexin-4